MIEQTRIPKLILTPSQIEAGNRWRLKQNDIMESCYDCNSNLFYIEKQYGIIAEELDYGVVGYKEKRHFRLTEIGLNLHCAECGEFQENYTKWFYPEDLLVMTFDEVDDVEQIEVEHCLSQYNQKHDFEPRYDCMAIFNLKEKLNEYIKNHTIKENKKVGKKK